MLSLMRKWLFDTRSPQEAPGMWISLSLSEKWAHEIDEDAFRGSCSIKLKKKSQVVYRTILREELFNSRLFLFPPARDA